MNTVTTVPSTGNNNEVSQKSTYEVSNVPEGSFKEAYFNAFKVTNDFQKESNQAQLDYATGKSDDILAVSMAQEKATTALTFTVQLTNRMLSSYKEIMSMQL